MQCNSVSVVSVIHHTGYCDDCLDTLPNLVVLGSLCGIEPIKETSMVVTNGAASFEWRGYGLKVHIPQNSLPPGVTEVKLKVIACLTGQFLFPDDSELVSAVYAVSSPCHFSSGLTLEIQHCAPMDGPLDNSSLTFVTAMSSPESALPYRFVPCKGGVFTREYQYGSIKTSHFSLFAIARYNDRTVHRPYGYSGHLFCAWNRPSRCSVYFTVTKELDASVSVSQIHVFCSLACAEHEFEHGMNTVCVFCCHSCTVCLLSVFIHSLANNSSQLLHKKFLD